MTPIYNLGAFGTNCYIIETFRKSCVLIDAPCQGQRILDKITELGLSLKLILLTHGHIDHINAASFLQEKTGCKVMISALDAEMLTDSKKSLADRFNVIHHKVTSFETFEDGDTLELEHLRFKVIATPGHTPGSVCFELDGVIYSGDTLFAGSVGRWDFESGDYSTLMQSMKKLMDNQADCTVYPGHGEPTELFKERDTNPYINF